MYGPRMTFCPPTDWESVQKKVNREHPGMPPTLSYQLRVGGASLCMSPCRPLGSQEACVPLGVMGLPALVPS